MIIGCSPRKHTTLTRDKEINCYIRAQSATFNHPFQRSSCFTFGNQSNTLSESKRWCIGFPELNFLRQALVWGDVHDLARFAFREEAGHRCEQLRERKGLVGNLSTGWQWCGVKCDNVDGR